MANHQVAIAAGQVFDLRQQEPGRDRRSRRRRRARAATAAATPRCRHAVDAQQAARRTPGATRSQTASSRSIGYQSGGEQAAPAAAATAAVAVLLVPLASRRLRRLRIRIAAVGTTATATSIDRATAALIAMAMSRKSCPASSSNEEHGNEHGQVGERGVEQRAPDFAGAFDRGRFRALAQLMPAIDVFQHHDRVIDQHADGEREAAEGRHVERAAQQRPSPGTPRSC